MLAISRILLALCASTVLCLSTIAAPPTPPSPPAASASYYQGTVKSYTTDLRTGNVGSVWLDTDGDGEKDKEARIRNGTKAWDEEIRRAYDNGTCISFDLDQDGYITHWTHGC